MPIPVMRTSPWIKVRNSKIHGKGVFAAKRIPKGTRVIEYLGERISHGEADVRYADHDPNDNHTFLFVVNRRTVIDANHQGNDARFINHSCDGNCESAIEDNRVFIDAKRTIEPGEELGYDYEIGRDASDPDNVDEIYACRCGTRKCRGSMLWPTRSAWEREQRAKARTRAIIRAKSKSKVNRTSKSSRKTAVTRSAKPKRAR